MYVQAYLEVDLIYSYAIYDSFFKMYPIHLHQSHKNPLDGFLDPKFYNVHLLTKIWRSKCRIVVRERPWNAKDQIC